MSSPQQATSGRQSSTQPSGQPKLLYFLCAVELWERYGFYTMRSLLVLYMSKVLLFSDSTSYGLFGAFTALIWLTPVVGGNIADRYFGYQRSMIIGGGMFILGYALLAVHSQTTFYLALSLLLLGNGFFKPGVASLVGKLYGKNDARRDGGFTIYYMFINLGGLLGPFLAGFIAYKYGWSAGFSSAAVGMLVGMVVFMLGRHKLGDKGKVPDLARLRQRFMLGLSNEHALYIGLLLLIFLGYWLLHHVQASNYVLELMTVVVLIAFFIMSFRQQKHVRNRMLGSLVLVIFSIAFWSLYQQAPMTVNLFTDRDVNRHIFGMLIPTSSYQSLNPIFIVLFTPILNSLWQKTGTKNRFYIPTSLKFTLGIILMGLGFLVLSFSVYHFANQGIVSSWWVVFSYALQSIGELAISPIGLAMMTAMAPKNMSGMMMGTWWLASAVSNAIGGSVAKLASVPKGEMTHIQSSHIYAHAFNIYGWVAIAVGIFSLLLVPVLKNMMGEKRERA